MEGFSFSKAERAAMNAAFMAGVRRPLSEADFKNLEELAAQCPIRVTKKDFERIWKTYTRLQDLLLKFSPETRVPEITDILLALQPTLPVPQTKVANKARAKELDDFLISFVNFYCRCGGHARMRDDSNCARFVREAAGRAAKEAGWAIKDGTVTDLIRDRVRAVIPPRPKTGTPTLGISQPEKPPPDDESCT
jgi:hypothetical protein